MQKACAEPVEICAGEDRSPALMCAQAPSVICVWVPTCVVGCLPPPPCHGAVVQPVWAFTEGSLSVLELCTHPCLPGSWGSVVVFSWEVSKGFLQLKVKQRLFASVQCFSR